MLRGALIVLIVVLGGASLRAAAQEAHPPQPPQTPPATDQNRPTHGIIRKPQPKPPADPAKPATTTEPRKPAEPVKATHPPSSTEDVAAAIANAVRSLEEKEKNKGEATAHPEPVRSTRRAAPRAVPQRRYSVTWPSQRVEVQWAAPADRILLSWGAEEAAP